MNEALHKISAWLTTALVGVLVWIGSGALARLDKAREEIDELTTMVRVLTVQVQGDFRAQGVIDAAQNREIDQLDTQVGRLELQLRGE